MKDVDEWITDSMKVALFKEDDGESRDIKDRLQIALSALLGVSLYHQKNAYGGCTACRPTGYFAWPCSTIKEIQEKIERIEDE